MALLRAWLSETSLFCTSCHFVHCCPVPDCQACLGERQTLHGHSHCLRMTVENTTTRCWRLLFAIQLFIISKIQEKDNIEPYIFILSGMVPHNDTVLSCKHCNVPTNKHIWFSLILASMIYNFISYLVLILYCPRSSHYHMCNIGHYSLSSVLVIGLSPWISDAPLHSCPLPLPLFQASE